MKHLVGAAVAAILVLAVGGVSSMSMGKGHPPRGGPGDMTNTMPPRAKRSPHHDPMHTMTTPRTKRSPQEDPMSMMTTMTTPRTKRSPQEDPISMTTTMSPRAKRSPQDGAPDCPPPPHGPPPHGSHHRRPHGPPPHGPPPCAPPQDMDNSSTPATDKAEDAAENAAQMRKKRSPQNPPDESATPGGMGTMPAGGGMPGWQIPNGNMGKVSNVIISTT